MLMDRLQRAQSHQIVCDQHCARPLWQPEQPSHCGSPAFLTEIAVDDKRIQRLDPRFEEGVLIASKTLLGHAEHLRAVDKSNFVVAMGEEVPGGLLGALTIAGSH